MHITHAGGGVGQGLTHVTGGLISHPRWKRIVILAINIEVILHSRSDLSYSEGTSLVPRLSYPMILSLSYILQAIKISG